MKIISTFSVHFSKQLKPKEFQKTKLQVKFFFFKENMNLTRVVKIST